MNKVPVAYVIHTNPTFCIVQRTLPNFLSILNCNTFFERESLKLGEWDAEDWREVRKKNMAKLHYSAIFQTVP